MNTPTQRLAATFLLVTGALFIGSAPACAQSQSAEADPAETKPATEGVLLGRFFIRDIRGSEGVRIRLSFALYGAVEPERADAFRAALTRVEKRVKSEVLVAVRTSQLRDFQEPELTRFRRRTLLRLRRTTPELPIDQLLIGEFEYFVDQR